MLFRRSDNSLAADFHGPIDEGVIFNIRWVAIFGQGAALLFTAIFLKLDLPLLPALVVIGLSVLLNLWQILNSRSRQKRHWYNSMALGFDVLQLAALLYLTGGLLNPFSVMILAPVVVSAVVMGRKSTLLLIGLVAVSVSFLAFFHHPLAWQESVQLPPYYLAGVWMALILSSCFFKPSFYMAATYISIFCLCPPQRNLTTPYGPQKPSFVFFKTFILYG